MKVGTDSVLLGAWVDVTSANPTTILDVGTGSGILALMLAQRCPNARIDAVEIDEAAYQQAKDNVLQSSRADRIRVYHQSFQAFSKKHSATYDLIVSNPPYFVSSLPSPNAQRSVARHASSLSQNELIEGTLNLLKPDGRLAVVLPYTEGETFSSTAKAAGLYCARTLPIRPNPSKPVHRLLLEFSLVEKQAIVEKELCIELSERHAYSEEYRELTKDFYLKF